LSVHTPESTMTRTKECDKLGKRNLREIEGRERSLFTQPMEPRVGKSKSHTARSEEEFSEGRKHKREKRKRSVEQEKFCLIGPGERGSKRERRRAKSKETPRPFKRKNDGEDANGGKKKRPRKKQNSLKG